MPEINLSIVFIEEAESLLLIVMSMRAVQLEWLQVASKREQVATKEEYLINMKHSILIEHLFPCKHSHQLTYRC